MLRVPNENREAVLLRRVDGQEPGTTDEYHLTAPIPPTRAEIAEYEAWLGRWEEVWKTGNERNWLTWDGGYDEGREVPQHPVERYALELEQYQSRREARKRMLEVAKEQDLLQRAEVAAQKAATAARERVMRGRG
jgi:hypothetical protein